MTFLRAASTDEVPDGERIVVEFDGLWVAIFNVNDKLYAVEDVCTHDDGPLAEGTLDGLKIECPRHGARFDLATGKPTMPAVKPVARFPVQIVDDEVQVDIDNPL